MAPKYDGRFGRFPNRLYVEESVVNALRALTIGCERYIIIVNKSWSDWLGKKGERPEHVLFETDALDFDQGLDGRLRKSRKVHAIVVDQDGGVVEVDMKARTWRILAESDQVRKRIREVDDALREGLHPQRFSSTAAAWIAVAPFVAIIVVGMLLQLIDPNLRSHFDAPADSRASSAPYPGWFYDFMTVALYCSPICLVIAAMLFVPVVLAGGLHIWPELLTWRSVFGMLFQAGRSIQLPQDGRSIFVGVTIAFISALLTFWFTK
ncbi:hypothetical protein [Nonomuraea dietziae]|uniref:hypothetical protein n=1 Tax=Nonomuraea dietziae TaxID=65515 RepID=UPI0033C2BD7E